MKKSTDGKHAKKALAFKAGLDGQTVKRFCRIEYKVEKELKLTPPTISGNPYIAKDMRTLVLEVGYWDLDSTPPTSFKLQSKHHGGSGGG